MQLGGDAQRQVHVQAVVEGLERPSVRATGGRLQDGCLGTQIRGPESVPHFYTAEEPKHAKARALA